MASKLDSIACITIPGEVASLTGNTIVKEAALVHKKSFISDSVEKAIDSIIMQNSTNSNLRILISGSLYLCGHILSDHA